VAASSSLERKKEAVERVSSQLAAAQALILAEYRGLSVGAMTGLRAKARGSGVDLRVLKNTLARRAVQGTRFEKLSEQMSGPLVYGFAKDPIAGAKVLADFAREHEHFVIRAGAMPNAVMSAAEVKMLATMPGRQELLAKLAGTLQAPMAKLVRTLNEVPGKFVRTLAALRDAREKPAG
jgi:large subunit ribosomal protein L10